MVGSRAKQVKMEAAEEEGVGVKAFNTAESQPRKYKCE